MWVDHRVHRCYLILKRGIGKEWPEQNRVDPGSVHTEVHARASMVQIRRGFYIVNYASFIRNRDYIQNYGGTIHRSLALKQILIRVLLLSTKHSTHSMTLLHVLQNIILCVYLVWPLSEQNECPDRFHLCKKNEICRHTYGSYTCQCDQGWTGAVGNCLGEP